MESGGLSQPKSKEMVDLNRTMTNMWGKVKRSVSLGYTPSRTRRRATAVGESDSASVDTQPASISFPSSKDQSNNSGNVDMERDPSLQDSSMEIIEQKSGNKTVPTKKAMQKLRDKLKAKNKPSKDERDSDTELPSSPMNEAPSPPYVNSLPNSNLAGSPSSTPGISSPSMIPNPNSANLNNNSSNLAGNAMSAFNALSNNTNANNLGSPNMSNTLSNLSTSPQTGNISGLRKFTTANLQNRKPSLQSKDSQEDSEGFNPNFFIKDKEPTPNISNFREIIREKERERERERDKDIPNVASPSSRRGRSLSSAANIERPVIFNEQQQQSLHSPSNMASSPSNLNSGIPFNVAKQKLKVDINAESSSHGSELGETPSSAYRNPIDLSEGDSESLLKKIDRGNAKAAVAHDEAYENLTRFENNFEKLNASLTNLIHMTEESLNTVLGCYAPINEESSEIKSTLLTLKEGQERLGKEVAHVHEALESEAKMVDTGFEQFNELSQEFRQTMILGNKPSKTKEIFWIVISWILALLASILWVAISATRFLKGIVPGFISKPISVWSRSTPAVSVSSSMADANQLNAPSAASSSSSSAAQNVSQHRSLDTAISTNPEVWRKRLRAYFDEKNQA